MAKTLLFIMGTRPEVIKLAPVIHAADAANLTTITCLTGQHPELSEPVIAFFNLRIDYRLATQPASLPVRVHALTAQLSDSIAQLNPDMILVQGDTLSTYAGALAGVYQGVPVVHVEAGLRSGHRHHPFPEELNRRLISQLATVHCAPTATAVKNLHQSGITRHVIWTGNTGIDALHQVRQTAAPKLYGHQVLVTCHRRENWGAPLQQLCAVMNRMASRMSVAFIHHGNPALQAVVEKYTTDQVVLYPPVPYHHMIHMMCQAAYIITDSGGIQEEATCLGKPVLVFRKNTERQDSILSGNSQLVTAETLYNRIQQLEANPAAYQAMAQPRYLYGDGHAAQRIVRYIQKL